MKTIQVGDVVGDYTVVEALGAGGTGAVYKIEHLITKRIEAMKLLAPGWSAEPEQVRRFEREIQLQAGLHHPNIVPVYNAVRDGECMALVMEYVEGHTLKELVEAGPLPVPMAVDFACQLLRALEYAHAAGVVHRDVSPANVIVTPERVAKLTDFGLAKEAGDLRLSTAGAPVGSPWYMSPEQVKGVTEPDARTDIYAMGAVLHEMLTGQKLFEGDGAFAVMLAQVEAEPRLPSSLNSKLPVGFDAVVAKAVAKDPAMRYGSAAEFRAAVEEVGVYTVRAPRLMSRTAVLWGMAPAAVMAASFGVVRMASPRVVPARPAPPAVVVAAPVSTPVAPVETPAVAAEVVKEKPSPVAVGATPRPRPRVVAKAPERSTALRVTGADVVAPPTVAAAMPAPVPKASPVSPAAVEAPQPAPVAQPVVEAASEPQQEAAPVATQESGNRFVKALGKINPFRKRSAPKEQFKK